MDAATITGAAMACLDEVLLVAVRTGMRLVGLPSDGPALRAELRHRPVPWAALGLGALLLAGFVLSLAWPAALATLARHPGSDGGWQLFTAPFVQEGLLGGAWNVVTGVIVLAVAVWAWGSVRAVVIWLIAAWAPVGDAAHLVGYQVSQSHLAAYSAGSSGATYFTAASVCALLAVTGPGRTRWLGLVAPLIGLAMWILTNDGHGVLTVEGFVAGLLLAAVTGALGRATNVRFPATGRSAPRIAGPTMDAAPAQLTPRQLTH